MGAGTFSIAPVLYQIDKVRHPVLTGFHPVTEWLTVYFLYFLRHS